MPDFPATSSFRVIGPSQAVVLIVSEDTTEAPLQVLNSEEEGVAEVDIAGVIRTVSGAFWGRGTTLADSVDVTS